MPKIPQEQKERRQAESKERQKQFALEAAELAKKVRDTFPQFSEAELRLLFPLLFP
jgi:hypothetical protein